MAEEYLLVKKTTFDRMKEKPTEEDKNKISRDQGVNTDKTMTDFTENEEENNPPQSGSGLLYVGNRKRKANLHRACVHPRSEERPCG